MWKLAQCIVEVIVLLLVARILYTGNRGNFNPNPDHFSSNPAVAAAIGNAANRHFENSQANVAPTSVQIQYPSEMLGLYSEPAPSTVPYGFPQVTVRGYAQNSPEVLVDWMHH